MTVRFLPEAQTEALITHKLAYDAVRSALIAAASNDATVFPALVAHGGDARNIFTVKSGSSADYAGVKIGSYWPDNDARGLPRHGTTVLLLDQNSGRIAAAVEAATVNAFRTAAADAVAADILARPDTHTLAVFGNGHQALYECLALSQIRDLRTVLVVARDPERGDAFCEKLRNHGLEASLVPGPEACAVADMIVTATTSREPLFNAEWVRPGTHVATMGSDSPGKQELPVDLLRHARLFCDLPSQSLVIGEFQHVADLVRSGQCEVSPIGPVLAGEAAGRRSVEEVTVFDSSGIALQDLAVATVLLSLAGDETPSHTARQNDGP